MTIIYNILMTKKSKAKRRGFTIIEVSLVLAIAGLIFAGVTIGITTNIKRQRYSDATNDLVNYLRSAYSSVVNVSSGRSTIAPTTQIACSFNDNASGSVNKNDASYAGRSACAVYGRVITFDTTNNVSTIRSYDLVGTADEPSANDTLAALREVKADIIGISLSNGQCTVGPSNPDTYQPSWGAYLQGSEKSKPAFNGTLLIVRSPITSTVHTYYSPDKISEVNSSNPAGGEPSCKSFYTTNKTNSQYKPISTQLANSKFKTQEVNICINTPDLDAASHRRAIRINADGRNASAINLLAADSQESRSACP